MLKIAIQKSGRLSEGSLSLLRKCGMKFNSSKNQLTAPALNFPAQILFLRDDDIPQYVEDGVADIGIVGENVLLEKGGDVAIVKRLGFSKCRMCLAIPKGQQYTDTSYFHGKQIATSYPKILQRFLQEKGVKAEIHEISGSVEIAPGIGLAEGIMDIVSTGSTLLSNGLKEVELVLKSEAVLIKAPQLQPKHEAILDQLTFRIGTVLAARDSKYILLNAPNDKVDEISKILPGMKSPTVMPLAEAGWSSIHSVVEEGKFWEIINQLRDLGAEGILVIPIEKMII